MGEIQDGSAVFTVRDKRAQAFVDFVYPVGIVVALANDKKPAFMNYGTWEKVAEDRVLQGSSDGNAPGTKLEPGLPNITGQAYTETNCGFFNFSNFDNNVRSGCFDFGDTITGRALNGQNSMLNSYALKFDASKSNEIYGKSETVQPPAYVVAYWQRTA